MQRKVKWRQRQKACYSKTQMDEKEENLGENKQTERGVWEHLSSSWFAVELFISNLHINDRLSVSSSLFFYISLFSQLYWCWFLNLFSEGLNMRLRFMLLCVCVFMAVGVCKRVCLLCVQRERLWACVL